MFGLKRLARKEHREMRERSGEIWYRVRRGSLRRSVWILKKDLRAGDDIRAKHDCRGHRSHGGELFHPGLI